MVYVQAKNPNMGQFLRALKLEKIGTFYGHLEYITDSGAILWQFGSFSPLLVYCVMKNLATLSHTILLRHFFPLLVTLQTSECKMCRECTSKF
jgi:hypothetical protein